MQYFHQEGGGRTPGTPYAGSATVVSHGDLCDKYKSKIKDDAVAETVHDALLYKYP